MSPTQHVYGGWPRSGEIDIFELIGQYPNRVVGTAHWGSPPEKIGAYGYNNTITTGYNVYAIEWEPGEIRWYLNGALYHRSTPADGWYAPGTNNPNAPFDQDFYIKLNLAVGGFWPGTPDASTPFPAEMRIDYVRVYQR